MLTLKLQITDLFQLTTFENALFGDSQLNSLFDTDFREVLEYLGDLKHYYKDCYLYIVDYNYIF